MRKTLAFKVFLHQQPKNQSWSFIESTRALYHEYHRYRLCVTEIEKKDWRRMLPWSLLIKIRPVTTNHIYSVRIQRKQKYQGDRPRSWTRVKVNALLICVVWNTTQKCHECFYKGFNYRVLQGRWDDGKSGEAEAEMSWNSLGNRAKSCSLLKSGEASASPVSPLPPGLIWKSVRVEK